MIQACTKIGVSGLAVSYFCVLSACVKTSFEIVSREGRLMLLLHSVYNR